MRKWLGQFKYDWTLLFLLIFVLSLLLKDLELWVLVIFIILIIRIFTLHNKTYLLAVSFSCLLLGTYSLHHVSNQQVSSLPFTPKEQAYQLYVDAINLRQGEHYLSGQALLIGIDQEIPVELFYWFEDDNNIPQEVFDKNTIWQVSGEITEPDAARNFHVFDYHDYLENQSIHWQITINKVEMITLASSLDAFISNLRMTILKPFTLLKELTWVRMHNRLLFNLETFAQDDYKDQFIGWGVLHFFAISGFHIHFIRKIISYLLLRSGLTQEWSNKLTFLFLLFYGWLIQWPIGVVRAVATDYLRQVCHKLNLPFSPFDQLALVGISLLIINPLLGQSLGFILSFLMTFVIRWYFLRNTAKRASRQLFEMNFLCLLFSWPIFMQTSFEINLFQIIIISVFTILFNNIVMPLSFLTTVMLILNFSFNKGLFSFLSEQLIYLLDFIQQIDTSYLFTHITGVLPTAFFFLLLWVGYFYLLHIHSRPIKTYIIVTIVYMFLLFVLPFLRPKSVITVLDVGQGDALLIQPAWTNEAWLIDTGGRIDWSTESIGIDLEYANNNLIPALKALGVKQLTGVVITHPDTDHIGNLVTLNQEIIIERLFISEYTYSSDLFQQISPLLKPNLEIHVVTPNTVTNIKSDQLFLITLDESVYKYNDVSNDSSILVWLQIGDYSFLNLGDITAQAEEKLVATYPSLRPTFLKLAHHGSQTSSSDTILQSYKPSIALISAGVDNRYGHPHKEVIERLNHYGVPSLSTSERGAIQITLSPFLGLDIHTKLP